MSRNDSKFDSLLTLLGYSRHVALGGVTWKHLSWDKNNVFSHEIEILERKNILSITKCKIKINTFQYKTAIEKYLKTKFGKNLLAHKIDVIDDRIQVLLALGPTKTKTKDNKELFGGKGCVIGWSIGFDALPGCISLQFLDAFTLGEIRQNWWQEISDVSIRVLSKHCEIWNTKHFREHTFDVVLAPLTQKQRIPEFDKNHDFLNIANTLKVNFHLPIQKYKAENEFVFELNPNGKGSYSETSIEIIQARETAKTWQIFDEKACRNEVPQKVDDASVMTIEDVYARAAAFPNQNLELLEEKSNPVEFALNLNSILAISGMVHLNQSKRNSISSVQIVSELVRRVGDKYKSFGSEIVVTRLISEILGDAWNGVDTEMTRRCWTRALEMGANKSRVLHKLKNLEKSCGNFESEFEAICDLTTVEARKDELELLGSRLIELAHEHHYANSNFSENYLNALKILSVKLPSNYDICIALSEKLIEVGQHRYAMHLLEDRLSHKTLTEDNPNYARMNAILAKIWHQYEGNVELATVRYVMATKSTKALPESVLNSAECFFIETNNFQQVQRILQLRSITGNLSSKIDALEMGAKYFDDHKKTSESIEQVLKLIELGKVQMWYLDILSHAAELDHGNFESIIKAFLNADTDDLNPTFVTQWNLAIYRYAHKFPSLRDASLVRIANASIASHLKREESEQVIAYMASKSSKDELAEFVQSRIDSVQDEELESLLNVVLKYGLRGTKNGFENALIRYCNASNSCDLISSRLRDFLVDMNFDGVKFLVDKMIHSNFNPQNALRVIDICSSVASDLQKSNKSDLVNYEAIYTYLYTQRSDLQEFSQDEKIKIVNIAFDSGFFAFSKSLVVECMQCDILLIKDETTASKLFANEHNLLSHWYFISSQQQSDAVNKLYDLEKCVSIWRFENSIPSYFFIACCTLAESGRFALDKLNELEKNSILSDSMQQFLDVLYAVVTNSTNGGSLELLHWFMRLNHAVLDDYHRSVQIYREWVAKKDVRSQDDIFTLGMLYYKSQEIVAAQECFVDILSNPEVLKTSAILMESLTLLQKTSLERTRFASIIHAVISWAKACDDLPLVELLINRTIKWKVADYDDLAKAFLINFGTESPDNLAHIAAQALSKVERHSNGVMKAIVEWKNSPAVESNPQKWWDVVKAMTKDRNLGQLRRASRVEILNHYAQYLYEQEELRFDSLSIFEMIAFENPMDVRAWIPLYSLYEECAVHTSLLTHLERIIPLLERDKTPLEKSPFNLESLKNSLKRVKSKLLGQVESSTPLSSMKFDSTNQQILSIKNRVLQRTLEASSPVVAIDSNELLPKFKIEEDSSQNPLMQDVESPLLTGFSAEQFEGANAINLQNDSDNYRTNMNFNDSGSYKTNLNFEDPKESSFNSLSVVNSSPNQSLSSSSNNEKSASSIVNWRTLLQFEGSLVGITDRILTMAFASEVEKHIAVQVASILSGEMKTLETWHWQVWRKSNLFEYPTNGLPRMPESEGFREYGGLMHKLLRLIYPVLLRANKHKFQYSYRDNSQGVRSQMHSTAIDMSHPAISRTGLQHFIQLITDMRIKFVDSPNLGLEVFFDLSTRTMHFDSRWHLEAPPSILMHRVLFHLHSLQKGYFGLIDLEPSREIIPVINEIKEILSSTGIERLRIAFGMRHKEIFEQLKKVSREQLISLLTSEGTPKATGIIQLQQEMRLKVYSLNLASTLDLIGLLESLTGKNLCDNSFLTARKVLEIHPLAKTLISFAGKLKL